MPITERQRQQRQQQLGSSDAAAAVGVSKWKTPLQLYLEKLGRIEPEPQNFAMEAGNAFEDGVLALAEKKLGVRPRRNVRRVHPEFKWWVSHLDGQLDIDGQAIPIDAKFSADTEDWGTSGSDLVPEEHLIQLHHQCASVGAPYGYVAAFLFGSFGKRRFELYRIDIDPELAAFVRDGLERFWHCVVNQTEPENASGMDIDAAKRIIKDPVTWRAVDGGVVAQLEAAKANLKEAQKAKDDAEAELLVKMGSDGVAVYRDVADGGRKAMQYREESAGKRIDTAALKKDHPDIYERYAVASTRKMWRPASLEKIAIPDAQALAAIKRLEAAHG